MLAECKLSVSNQTVQVKHLIKIDNDLIGPAAIRNHLVGMATTEWILFLDDDDLLDADYVESVLPYFDEGDAVYTWGREMADCLQQPFDEAALRRSNFIPVTMCVRKSIFEQVGGFPLDIHYEDWGLWLRLLDEGARFKCVAKIKWTYRSHDLVRRSSTPSFYVT